MHDGEAAHTAVKPHNDELKDINQIIARRDGDWPPKPCGPALHPGLERDAGSN